MKKNLIFLMMIMFAANSAFAKIWRVNNTGVATDFTTPQAAVNAAGVVDGDTIHIEPSGTSYGNITLTKRLIIIGNGYFLGTSGSNSNPDLQANPATSTIGDLYVNSGGSNSVIMGMTMNYAYIGYSSNVNNLLFRRNRVITSVFFYSAGTTNVQVMQCYIDGNISQSASHTNVLIANNIVIQGANFDADDNGAFQNNIMHATGAGYTSSFQNFTLRSNILVAGGITGLTNCIVENNLSYSTQFGTANGNQQNIDMSTVFAGYPTIGTNSYDGRYVLKAGSPAIATGYGSVDCGAYGNTPAYVKSGMPDVPSIYKLSVPPIVTNNVLSVIVSTKINQ
jgi:hypothetical protein